MLCVFVSHLRLPTCLYLSDCLGVPDIASWKQEAICKHKEVPLKAICSFRMYVGVYMSVRGKLSHTRVPFKALF